MPDYYHQLLNYSDLSIGQKIWFHKRAELDEKVKKILIHYPIEWDTYRKAYHFAFLSNSNEIPKCVVCKSELLWKPKYNQTQVCSQRCRNLNPITQQKYRNSCNERYGKDYASQTVVFRNTAKKTNIEKYGVENPMQSECVRETHKARMIQTYGVDNIFKKPDYIREKVREQFGVDHMMHLPEVFNNSIKSLMKFKTYTFDNGDEIKVQGNEPDAISILESQGYTYSDLIVENSKTPKIFYKFDGRTRRYYCDIFIPKENRIIEVKSNYTYNTNYEQNQLKKIACIDAGYIFEFWIFNGKQKELEIIK